MKKIDLPCRAIRGSIPLLWEQIVDLRYKPRLRIISHEEMPKVVERYFHDLTQRYGEVVAVDLTYQHGDEGELSRAYAAEMRQLPHVRGDDCSVAVRIRRFENAKRVRRHATPRHATPRTAHGSRQTSSEAGRGVRST
ncbi:hypothetical protein ACLOJK_018459 [Asimina triloba]